MVQIFSGVLCKRFKRCYQNIILACETLLAATAAIAAADAVESNSSVAHLKSAITGVRNYPSTWPSLLLTPPRPPADDIRNSRCL